MSFKKQKPKINSKNAIKRRVKEVALIIAAKAKQLDLTPKEVAVKIDRGEIKL